MTDPYHSTVNIRTPDQRLRIFVSSTLQELAPERRAVGEAIASLHLTPVMFELGARPHPPRDLYRAYLAQSDVFIGLYWERYGWVAPGEPVSGLEDEYTLSGDRPKLIYLKSPAPERDPRLGQLLDRIRSDDRVSYRSFHTAEELRGLVADDLAILLTERFGTPPAAASEGGEAPVAARLPRPLTRLIGRKSEIEGLTGRISAPGGRLVTLVGPGGVGKTRLALAVAGMMQEGDRFADGVRFVDLSAVTEHSLLLPAIAQGIGLREQPGTSVGFLLREALRDRRMLIVLDNFEQLAESATELADVLITAPELVLLVTSRVVLNIRGEYVVHVNPLAVSPPTGEGERSTADSEAVALFLERAEAMSTPWSGDAAETDAVAEICRRLDGLPLAIELAAARTRLLRPSALVQRMDHRRLDLLEGGIRDLPPRQRTLRETIEWSHSLLAPEAQTLFRRLAVFSGSAALEAVEAITGSGGSIDVLGALSELTDATLVRPLDAPEPRIGMLETIRAYAVERLDASGEAAQFRGRHREYYLAFAETHVAPLYSRAQLDVLGRLSRENDNFRSVLRRALRADDPDTALRLGQVLPGFWHVGSLLSEGRSWMDAVRALPSATPAQRAVAWTVGAVLAFWQGDLETIAAGLREAEAAMRTTDDRRTQAFLLMLRAFAGSDPRSDEAREAMDEAITLFDQERANPMLRLVGPLTGAYFARLRGEYAEAVRRGRWAMGAAREAGDRFSEAISAAVVASSALALGQLDDARGYAVAAARAYDALGNENGVAYALELAGLEELTAGRHAHALRLYAMARLRYRRSGTRPWATERPLHEALVAGLSSVHGERLGELTLREQGAELGQELARLEALASAAPDLTGNRTSLPSRGYS